MTRRSGLQYWSPPAMWKGETAFVIGGGPSLQGFNFNRLRGRRTIAINAAGFDVPWADILFFTDKGGFFDRHRTLVDDWPGLLVTVSPAAKLAQPKALLLEGNRLEGGFPRDGSVRIGRSSGHTAVGLSVALGAARIPLLGFDMRNVDGRSNYHDRHHRGTPDSTYEGPFLRSFSGWHQQASLLGVAIVNATPDSALKEFPFVDIGAELGERLAA